MIRVSLGVTAGFRFRVWGLDSGLPVTGKFRVLSLSSRSFGFGMKVRFRV